MGEATDDGTMAAYPPEVFLEPWTPCRLRRLAWGLDDLRPLLSDRLTDRLTDRRAGESR